MHLLVSAGILLIRNTSSDPEILLLRSAEGHNWGPPKGHLEASETGIDAALREIYEETGLTFDNFDLVDGFQELIQYQSRSKRFKTVAFYLGEVMDSDVEINLSEEHSEYVWSPLRDALCLVELDIIRTLLCDAFSYIKCTSKYDHAMTCSVV